MKIQTIVTGLGDSKYFDKYVNAALLEGWTLKKRYLSTCHSENTSRMLIAELVKYDADRTEIRQLKFENEAMKKEIIRLKDEITHLEIELEIERDNY